jgi:hypothetical protein
MIRAELDLGVDDVTWILLVANLSYSGFVTRLIIITDHCSGNSTWPKWAKHTGLVQNMDTYFSMTLLVRRLFNAVDVERVC